MCNVKVYVFFILSFLSFHVCASPQTGKIFYLDGLPASGKSSLAKKLIQQNPSMVMLSTDDYAEENSITYYKAAKLMLKRAIELAKEGENIILDTFYISDLERYKSEEHTIPILVIGLWAPLETLERRFENRNGSLGSYKRGNFDKDYYRRYGTLSAELIRERKGSFIEESKEVSFDFFFDTSRHSPEGMFSQIFSKNFDSEFSTH